MKMKLVATTSNAIQDCFSDIVPASFVSEKSITDELSCEQYSLAWNYVTNKHDEESQRNPYSNSSKITHP